MVSKESRQKVRVKKHMKMRNRFSGTAERPRMCVFRSNKQIYVQVIDDQQGKTLVAAASNDKELAAQCKGKTGIEAAAIVGKAIAERALAKGITAIAFDRGGYLFHFMITYKRTLHTNWFRCTRR